MAVIGGWPTRRWSAPSIFAGYEVNHDWGTGGHSGQHATRIFPDAMRWLWKDWPEPVKAGAGSQQLREILVPGEGWTLVADGYRFTEGPAVNAQGEVFFNDIPNSKAYKIGLDGKVNPLARRHEACQRPGVRAGWPALCRRRGQGPRVRRRAARPTVIAEGFRGNDLVVNHEGGIYVTNPCVGGSEPSKVWYISPKGEKRVVDDTGLRFPNGITLSPDQTLLYRRRLPISLGL